MKTKLVYVLTCDPDKYYIEQAHISIFSARYHNPDATIVLIVDTETDTLFVGKRAELLQYLTEKIVVNVPNNLSTMQKSRWLKTSVRNLLDGDFLFIDCDTVITQDLSEVDSWDCPIGAVLSGHQLVKDYTIEDKDALMQLAIQCGWDFSDTMQYFSSGVMYVKDSKQTRTFYSQWKKNWEFSVTMGVAIDQISLQQTNNEFKLIKEISSIWNCIMYVRPSFVKKAHIIHFTALDNPSFLFSKRVLKKIYSEGLSPFLCSIILQPQSSFFPYLKADFAAKNLAQTIIQLAKRIEMYSIYIDGNFEDVNIASRFSFIILNLLKNKKYILSSTLWIFLMKFKHKYVE